MLLLLVLGLAQSVTGAFTRSYLRGLRNAEMQKWITSAADYIQDDVVRVAKTGFTHYTLEQPVDCVGVVENKIRVDHNPVNVIRTLEECEAIVDKIRKRVVKRFPDSDITYDEKTKKYTITWD